MNKSNLLVVLGNIFNTMQDEYLKRLLVTLFKAISDNKVNKLDLDILNLFDYTYTKYEYHNIKDSIDLILEYFNINKYNDIINVVRINNNLGLDNSYLTKLYNDLVKINDYNSLNNRFKGLFNLLNDNNLVYNNIGLRILIIKYLLNIDISKLNVYQLSNNRLNDKYSFIVYKNDKIKFYSKLYFINNDIILSTLQHDNISNVVFTLKDNVNSFYGGNNDIITDNNDITTDELDKYKYRYNNNGINNTIRYLYYLIHKVKIIELIGYPKKDLIIEYDSIKVNDNNQYKYLQYFNKNYLFLQRYNDLKDIYDKIIEYLINQDEFKSNDLNSKQQKQIDSLDYYKYKIDLKDYFLNP